MKTAAGLCLLATAALAPAETPSARELLVKPEVTARPVEGAAAASPSPVPSAPPSPIPPEPPGETPAGIPESPPDDLVPPPFPLERYEALWKRSPFQLESVAPPVESAGLAQRYALTGLAEVGGEPIAFLMERTTQQRMMIKKDDAGQAGLTLVQVDVATDKYSNSTATIRQGAEVGVVKFDAGPPAMSVPAMPVPGAPPIQPGNPSAQVPAMPVQGQVPGVPGQGAGVPQPAIPVPAVPPGAGVAPNGIVQPPGQPSSMPPPRVIRRRAIVPAAP
jgi:hypothetical protein